jgi:nicotinate-nucleotide pyrophosphorylase (carboxylating)
VIDLNALPLPRLFEALTANGSLDRLLRAARREDFSDAGDVTTAAMPDGGRVVRAAGVGRTAGTASGMVAIRDILDAFDCTAGLEIAVDDAAAFNAGAVLWRLDGPIAPILGVERTLLNIVGRMCGIATLTARYVEAVSGTGCVVCDTRKTTPGLRALEKYAVRCGGGTLHRSGLHDAMLLKDNHLAHLQPHELPDAVEKASTAARTNHDLRFVEVEVDDLEQFEKLLDCPDGVIDIILLDNFAPGQLREAVKLRESRRPGLLLEASGGVVLEQIADVAQTGVDRISVGALTHAASSLDVGLEVS